MKNMLFVVAKKNKSQIQSLLRRRYKIRKFSSIKKKKKNEHIFGWEGQKNTQAESKQKCHANNKAINLRLLSSLLILTILILYQYQQIISRNSLRLHF